jgi:hypothetical protein
VQDSVAHDQSGRDLILVAKADEMHSELILFNFKASARHHYRDGGRYGRQPAAATRCGGCEVYAILRRQ